jgi:hypothetical protein
VPDVLEHVAGVAFHPRVVQLQVADEPSLDAVIGHHGVGQHTFVGQELDELEAAVGGDVLVLLADGPAQGLDPSSQASRAGSSADRHSPAGVSALRTPTARLELDPGRASGRSAMVVIRARRELRAPHGFANQVAAGRRAVDDLDLEYDTESTRRTADSR